MSNPGLNINQAFREKVESNMDLTFDYKNYFYQKGVEEI